MSLEFYVMKILVTALFAGVSLFLAGCGKEPGQITSETSTPSPSPVAVVPESGTSVTSQTSVSETGRTPESAINPSPSATAKNPLVFKTEAATKAASAYLTAYNTLLNDINAPSGPRNADPETALNNALAQLKKVTQDNAEVANQESQVQQALTQDEVKRLLDYRKSLEEAAKSRVSEGLER